MARADYVAMEGLADSEADSGAAVWRTAGMMPDRAPLSTKFWVTSLGLH